MQVSAADQVDTVAAQRAARKAKILASGKDRLGRITKSHNDQASINDITNAGHLHSKANDAEESEREKEPPKLSESLSWASIESVHGSFDSLTGIPVDTAPTTFAPAFKSYSSTSRARAADMGRLATLERVQFIVISLGATTCMLVWIYMTGHLNHPAEMQLEPLTSEWARQVCRNLNYIARNPVSSAQFPALRLPLGDSAMVTYINPAYLGNLSLPRSSVSVTAMDHSSPTAIQTPIARSNCNKFCRG